MKKIISLILVISILFGMLPIVNAETGNITLTASSQNVNVGDTVDITLRASEVIQSADFNLNYPKDILELKESSISTDYYSVKDTHIQICYASNSGTDTFTFTFNVIKEGEATISTKIEKLNIDTTTEFQHDGDKTLKITATEKPAEIEVNSVTLNKSSLNLEVGDTETLTAIVEPDDATDKIVIWSSDKAEVASVENGTITALAEGTAQITATAGTKSATCIVTVTSKSNTPPTDPSGDDDLTWTDFEKSEFKIENISKIAINNYLILKIKNVTTIDGHVYYMFYSNSDSENIIDTITSSFDSITKISGEEGFNESGYQVPMDKHELSDNLYLYIIEFQEPISIDTLLSSPYKKNTIKLAKFPLNPLGERIYGHFNADSTNIELNEYISAGRKVNIKVGTINDVNILKSIKNGESDSLSKLLTYAKSDNGIITKSYTKDTGTSAITDNTSIRSLYNNWTSGGYYYVYMEYDDEDGKYRIVEDVSLYQCLFDNSNGTWGLYDYLSKDFKWNINDDGKTPTAPDKDDTTAKKPIPQAGETTIVVISIIGVLTIAIISIIKYRRYRDI